MTDFSPSMDKQRKTAVLLINTGSPDAPAEAPVRAYLAEFLGDRRIVELPRWKWWPILHGIILRTRPAKSARRYQGVWTEEGSPLIVHTRRTAEALAERLGGVEVYWAMRYGNPSVRETVDAVMASGVSRLLVMPMFAQYAAQTTAATYDAVCHEVLARRDMPALRFIHDYHDEAAYIEALRSHIEAYWNKHGAPMSVGGKLVMSFHGIPKKSSELGDVYESQCRRTAELLASALKLSDKDWTLAFQSRFGRDPWLEPYTLPAVESLAAEGTPRIDVVCPGFAADCLETIEEINDELRHAYEHAFVGAPGQRGEFHYISALNESEAAVCAYESIIRRELSGWI